MNLIGTITVFAGLFCLTGAALVCDGTNAKDMKNCCKKKRPCDEGQGDCNKDEHCAGDLKCGNNNCLPDFSSDGTIWNKKHDCCFSAVKNVPKGPSKATYDNVRDVLKGKHGVLLTNTSLIATAVRLAFHDCVGPNGCNGCVNLNSSHNDGLAGIIGILGEVRSANGFMDISNADFWQIVGISALELASNNSVDITFKGGRVDCRTTPLDHTDVNNFHPTPAMNRTEMMDWFANTTRGGFGMNETQVTALMGAHTLGKTTLINSGYRGAWIPRGQDVFDNKFYQVLNNDIRRFRTKELSSGKFQWDWASEGRLGILLNTDVELIYDIEVDNKGKFIGTCSLPGRECREAKTKSLVAEYAEDEAKFFKEFKDAYEKMMTVKPEGNEFAEPHDEPQIHA